MSAGTRSSSLLRLAKIGVGLFLAFQFVRIFLVQSLHPAPRDGVEAYSRVEEGGTLETSFYFLPDYDLILTFKGPGFDCSQLGSQMNYGGRRIVGRLYYVEKSRLIPFYLAPRGFSPVLHEIEVVASVGPQCGELPSVGRTVKLLLHRSDQAVIHEGAVIPRLPDPDLESVFRLYETIRSVTNREEVRLLYQGDEGQRLSEPLP